MLTDLRRAAVLFLLLTMITGLVYPGLVTGIARVAMADQANGSLIFHNGKAAGSALVGQPTSDAKYFWGRPSATSPHPYNAMASSGSNLGPTNPALIDAVKTRIAALRAADPDNKAPIPVDLVTASASGLDPHISPAAAEYQVERVARARKMTAAIVRALVAQHTEGRTFGVLGEPRVNVLRLNLTLDAGK
ncbi:MAG TPA: potassium-transporting ATPase subunit KdpC [Burkholderiaceae bacterium]|nr:potassium-transporting ATPase subunit KdpC [Burkholderiaceae bacterium]